MQIQGLFKISSQIQGLFNIVHEPWHITVSNVILHIQRILIARSASSGVSNTTIPQPFDLPVVSVKMSARTTLPVECEQL